MGPLADDPLGREDGAPYGRPRHHYPRGAATSGAGLPPLFGNPPSRQALLAKRYSPERLEAACHRALAIGGASYRSIKSILEHGLDRVPLEEQATLELPQEHDNLRGPDYYNSWN